MENNFSPWNIHIRLTDLLNISSRLEYVYSVIRELTSRKFSGKIRQTKILKSQTDKRSRDHYFVLNLTELVEVKFCNESLLYSYIRFILECSDYKSFRTIKTQKFEVLHVTNVSMQILILELDFGFIHFSLFFR